MKLYWLIGASTISFNTEMRMKKKFTLISSLLLLSIVVFGQQWHPISSNNPTAIKQQLVSSSEDQIVINFDIAGFYTTTVTTPQGKAAIVSVPKMVSMLETGAPDLPIYAVSAVIGDHAQMDVQILDAQYTDYENIEIAPSKGNFSRQIDPATVPYTYGAMYTENSFYPANQSHLQQPFILRNYRGQAITINPFSYNPVTKTLRVYHHLTVEMYKTGEGGDNQFTRTTPQIKMDPEFKYLYDRQFINYAEAHNRYPIVEEEGNMIVICYGPYMDAMQPFVEWKKTIGRPIEMFDVANVGTTPATIKAFITDYYNTNGLTHVLLVGDHQYVPSYNNSSSGGYSDNYYGYLAGSDSYNELFVGRFSAEAVSHVETMVQRVITYERDLDETATWVNVGTGVARNEGAGNGHNGGEADYVHMDYIRDTLLNYTYATVHREYDGNVPGLTNTSAAQISQRINDGTSIIDYCNHGSQNSWSVAGYTTSHVEALTNTDRWPVIWAVACDNGKFTNGTCFAETWTRATHNGSPTGAIGTMMSWISQPWQPPMTGQDEMVTILAEGYANNIKRTLGGNSINGSMRMIDLHGSSGQSTHDTWILFGDPSMTMRTDVPQPMTISHASTLFLGMTDLSVNADAENAIVCLTLDGEIMSTAYVQGGVANLTFPALADVGMLNIAVFGYNKVTYLNQIEVIPAEGPFIAYVSYEVNDAAGNNDGLVDYGETIGLGVTIENLGVSIADGLEASLSTDNSYVTLTDDSETYGSVEVGEEKFIADAFAFDVADDIPDNELITFTLTVSNNDNTWESSFSIAAHAPAFEIGSLMIADDINGNSNGRLDPGETAEVIFNFGNTGSSSAMDVAGELTLNNPFVTINDGSWSIPEVGGGVYTQAFFEISVSPAAPVGTAIELNCMIGTGAYSADKDFIVKVGLVLEDFETGDFSAFDWTSGGNLPWTITDTEVYEGTYAAKSGGISDSQSTQMLLTYDVSVDDSISFFRKVSSESGYDFMRFYIDSNKVGEWSGEVDWSRVVYPVSAGMHTFKWEYMKDGSVSSGSDVAFVDYIVLPASVSTTGWAGADAAICQGDDFQLNATANNFVSLLWETSGTGTFSDATILDPVYYPSDEDIISGSVTLTLVVTGESSTFETSMILTISPMPEATAGADAMICQGADFALEASEASYYSDLMWSTSGSGTFDDATALHPVYLPSEGDYTNGSVTLTLTAMGAGTCEDAVASLQLSFNELPTAVLEGSQTVCEGTMAEMTINLTGAAPWSVEMADGMGTYEIPTTPFTMEMMANEPMTLALATVTDNHGCSNTGEGSAVIDLNYAPMAPSMPAAPDTVDYISSTQSVITIEAVADATAYNWQLEPAEAGTMTMAATELTVDWNTDFIGTVEVKALSMNDCGDSDWSDAATIVLTSTVGLGENTSTRLKLYPNPGNGVFTLLTAQIADQKTELIVTDLLGEVVYQESINLNAQPSFNLDLSHLNNGTYLISLRSEHTNAIERIVIKR